MVGNYVTKVCTLYKLGLEVFIDDEDEILEKTSDTMEMVFTKIVTFPVLVLLDVLA
jgi:hypothetical protein